MGQHEQDDLTTGMTLQMVQLNILGQLERGHLERGVINVAPILHITFMEEQKLLSHKDLPFSMCIVYAVCCMLYAQ
jgi:hypothetical protein